MMQQTNYTLLSKRAILVCLFSGFYLLFGSTQSRANNPAQVALTVAKANIASMNPWLANMENNIELLSQKSSPMGWHFLFIQTRERNS